MNSRERLLSELGKNPFVLAPMAAITDAVYRSLMKKWGAGIVVSELISATGLHYQSQKTREMFRIYPNEHPVGIQLFGSDPEHLADAARFAEDQGADFVDLNCGCPVPKVVKKSAGSGLLRDLPLLTKIVNAMVKAVKIPVTVKIRTGWDDSSRNAHEVVRLLYEEGALWVAIHGRTRAQGYEGYADWGYVQEVAKEAKIPVIGNGDIVTPHQAVQKLMSTPCRGVMIGRGVLKDPFLLAKARSIWSAQKGQREDWDSGTVLWTSSSGATDSNHSSLSHQELFYRFSQDVFEYFCENYPPRIAIIQIRKILAWCATGYSNASQFRKNLYSTDDLSMMKQKVREFWFSQNYSSRVNKDNQGFLMGGHG